MRTFVSALLAGMLLLLGGAAEAGVLRTGTEVTIGPEVQLEENISAFGATVLFEGATEGDLITACRTLDVTGAVGDNLYAAAQTLRLQGPIGSDALVFGQIIDMTGGRVGDVRGACQMMHIDSEVDGDLAIAAQRITIGPSAVIKGDVYIAAQQVIVNGTVQGKLLTAAGSLTINGTVMGDVEAYADHIDISPTGMVEGKLTYHRESPLTFDTEDRVVGGIQFVKVNPREIRSGWSPWPCRVWSLLAALVTALILGGVFEGTVRRGMETFRKRTWSTLGIGLLGILLMPAVALVALVLVITAPAGAILLGLFPMFLYISWLLAALFVGSWLLTRFGARSTNIYLSALIGVVLLWLLALIPYAGGLVCLVVAIAGMGMLLIELYQLFWGRNTIRV